MGKQLETNADAHTQTQPLTHTHTHTLHTHKLARAHTHWHTHTHARTFWQMSFGTFRCTALRSGAYVMMSAPSVTCYDS